MKQLAIDLPEYEFVSVGGLIDAERAWFDQFSENLPKNYSLKTNLPGPDLLEILQESRVYVHLMEGEHFGIAPVEGLASGCVTIVHDSGGMQEFISPEYRWQSYADLKAKIVEAMEKPDAEANWEVKRKDLWSKIAVLTPEMFQQKIWTQVENIL